MLFNQSENVVVYNPVVANRQTQMLKKAVFMGVAVTLASSLVLMPEVAYAGGLDKATSGLERFVEDAKPFIRIFAVVALMLTAGGYMAGLVDKSKFFLIAAGLLIIGAAPDIVDMFWSK